MTTIYFTIRQVSFENIDNDDKLSKLNTTLLQLTVIIVSYKWTLVLKWGTDKLKGKMSMKKLFLHVHATRHLAFPKRLDW